MLVTTWDESKCPACGGSSLVDCFDGKPPRSMYDITRDRFHQAACDGRLPATHCTVTVPVVACCFLRFTFDPTRIGYPLVAIEWTTEEEAEEREYRLAEHAYVGSMGAE